MNARISQIAEGVKAILDAASLSQSFVAQVIFTPYFRIPEVKDLTVIVRPGSWQWQAQSRHDFTTSYAIDVAVMGQADPKDPTSPDPYLQLLEECADELNKPDNRGIPLTPAGLELEARYTNIAPTGLTEPMDFDNLRERNVFVGVITPNYVVMH